MSKQDPRRVDLADEARAVFAELLGTFALSFVAAGGIVIQEVSQHEVSYEARVAAPGVGGAGDDLHPGQRVRRSHQPRRDARFRPSRRVFLAARARIHPRAVDRGAAGSRGSPVAFR